MRILYLQWSESTFLERCDVSRAITLWYGVYHSFSRTVKISFILLTKTTHKMDVKPAYDRKTDANLPEKQGKIIKCLIPSNVSLIWSYSFLHTHCFSKYSWGILWNLLLWLPFWSVPFSSYDWSKYNINMYITVVWISYTTIITYFCIFDFHVSTCLLLGNVQLCK
jgi:hypothetical protein